MILYHGSNVKIATIDLSRSMRGKDFGQGFYLSADRKQAEEMAVFKAMQFDGDPVVTSFEFDERNLNGETLKVKVFEEYNRNGRNLFLPTVTIGLMLRYTIMMLYMVRLQMIRSGYKFVIS